MRYLNQRGRVSVLPNERDPPMQPVNMLQEVYRKYMKLARRMKEVIER